MANRKRSINPTVKAALDDGEKLDGLEDDFDEDEDFDEDDLDFDEDEDKEGGSEGSEGGSEEPSEDDDFYVVQTGYRLDGKEYVTGDTVPIHCRHCAIWKTKTPVGVLCHPKKEISDGIFMAEDQWSCDGDFFFSLELKDALTEYLVLEVELLTLLKKRSVVHAATLRGRQRTSIWFSEYCEKKAPGLDADASIDKVDELLSQFTHPDQMTLAAKFFAMYADQLRRRTRQSERRRFKFETGDNVEWTDRSGVVCTGFVARAAAGQITLICISATDDRDTGTTMTFKLSEWRDNYSPKIVKKAVREQVADS